ncbi:DCC1-like thiol-disulfide oxidoreductase family protein [Yoonia sp. 2307UL14-13]|uniref:DCC1-like thiol-disulfide oxidoreductase family protein n=1 Tax=Yoonia sp. 2307UL14-13 TaxID=3126506 RepID=UPI0030A43FF1
MARLWKAVGPKMTSHTKLSVIYDGQCPFCTAYVKMVRLRDAVGVVELIDARGDHPILGTIREQGFDLDEGMVVAMDGEFHHGDAAMTRLAAMTTRSGLFNRLVRLGFGNRTVSKLLYPPLVLGRKLTLRLLGRRPIDAP